MKFGISDKGFRRLAGNPQEEVEILWDPINEGWFVRTDLNISSTTETDDDFSMYMGGSRDLPKEELIRNAIKELKYSVGWDEERAENATYTIYIGEELEEEF